MKALPTILLIGCAACAARQPQQLTVHQQRQALLNAMADRCHIHRDIFRLDGDDQVELRLRVKDQAERVDCILRELKNSPVPLHAGFIGTEYYPGNAE